MIRVAFDLHSMGQRATGNETYAEALLRAFEAAPPPDIEFHFYHLGAMQRPPQIGVSHRVWPRWPYLRLAVVMPALLMRDRIDVAHFQYFAPLFAPTRRVVTIHDIGFVRHPEYYSRRIRWPLRALLGRQAQRAQHLITVSQATHRDIVDLYGIAPGDITVVHNGVGAEFREMAADEVKTRAARCWNFSRPIVLCVGNIGARKNQQRLVRVFGHLIRERGCEYDLVLVGQDGSPYAPIAQEIEAQGIKGRVHHLGYIERQDLVVLYNLATISVYPSLLEGFGLPILESMACGTPVITSSTSSMPEVAGNAAVLVEPRDDAALGDAIESLLRDTGRREELRRAGLARCADFTWAEAARRTIDVYRAVADGGR